jgi:hypothetical protein
MTFHLNTEDNEKTEKVEVKTSDEMVISDPVRARQTINVKFNRALGQFEGLPTEWRELLEMTP